MHVLKAVVTGLLATAIAVFGLTAVPAQAAPVPITGITDPGGGVVHPDQTPKDHYYKGAIQCQGGPSSWCWGAVFVPAKGTCANNDGCFWTPQGNFRVRSPYSGPYSGAQYACAAGFLVSGLSFLAAGPEALVVAGAVVTVWGCVYV